MEDLFLIIAYLIGVSLTICVFYMGANVKDIKDSVAPKTAKSHLLDYYKHMSFGDKNKAREALKSFIWSQGRRIQVGVERKPGAKEKEWQALEYKYGFLFSAIGEPFPKLVPEELLKDKLTGKNLI